MAMKDKERIELEKQIRAEVAAEYEEVNEIVAEAFELARMEKELEAKVESHMERRAAVLSKGTQQSDALKKQLDKSNLGRETRKQVSGTKAMAGRRVNEDEKKEVFKAGLDVAKAKADKDGWISQSDLIECADEFLDTGYSSAGSIFWKKQLEPLKVSPSKIKKIRQSVYLKIK